MLSLITLLSLGLSLFPNSAYCKDGFMKPPQDNDWSKSGRDRSKNVRYDAGDKIQIEWKHNHMDGVHFLLWQIDGETVGGYKLDSTLTEWKAEYNLSGGSIAGQDSVYYFQLQSKSDHYGILANSITFNVSAPAPGTEKKESQTVLPTTEEESSTTKPTAESSSTTAAASEETDATSDSSLPRGKTAGVAVGATIGAILCFSGAGWLL
ncbi:hypothetical protein ACHAPU_003324 [Fusarium lateritium]